MTPTRLEWCREGELQLAKALGQLTDADFAGACGLAGWTRQRLLAHVARNADALINLLTWARTGIETPMYASPDAREAGIDAACELSAADLRAEVLASSARLSAAISDLPDRAWAAQVRTAQGRVVPASAVLWMRCREVWVHAIDLNAGLRFDDIGVAILTALVDDVFAMWAGREVTPDITVLDQTDEEHRWGTGSVVVSGSVAGLAAWLTGRSSGADLKAGGPLPELPRWL